MRGLILLVLASLSLLACGANSFSFTEEVKLASGEVIVLKRTVKAKPLGEIGGPGGWENKGMTLEIQTPSKPSNPPAWNQTLVPVVMDIDAKTGEWFVVASFYTCSEAPDGGKKRYYEFRSRAGQWVLLPAITAELIGRESNILTEIRSSGEANHTLDSKKQRRTAGTMTEQSPFRRIQKDHSTRC